MYQSRDELTDATEALDLFYNRETRQLKLRLMIGFVVGDALYLPKKFGQLSELSTEEAADSGLELEEWIERTRTRMTEAAVSFWSTFPQHGTEEIPVFAWELGAAYEEDEDGEILGEWPQVGILRIEYTEAFLMRGGRLPEGRRHLRPLRMFPGKESHAEQDR